MLAKAGSKVLAGAAGGSLVGGGLATQREMGDMMDGGTDSATERLKRIGISTLAGAAG